MKSPDDVVNSSHVFLFLIQVLVEASRAIDVTDSELVNIKQTAAPASKILYHKDPSVNTGESKALALVR